MFTITVFYDTNRHGWGILDDRIEKAARGFHFGAGTHLRSGERDLSFEFKTKRSAKSAVHRLRRTFRGYRLRTTLGVS